MSALRKAVVSQFSRPHGLLGRLVGWIMATRPSNRQRNRWTLEQIAPVDGEILLEVGCGPGLGLAEAAGRAPNATLTGLDHSATMLAQARAKLHAEAPGTRLDLVEGTHLWLAEQPQAFDAIWSVNVVQFFPDMEEAFRLILGSLKPGGRVVTTYQPRHRNPTRADAIVMGERITAAMEAAGFTDIRTAMLELEPVDAVSVYGARPKSLE